MGIIAWIIVGLIAGWLAKQFMGGPGGLLHNLAIGLVGAIVGGFLLGALGLIPQAGIVPQIISATIGAIVFLFIWRAIKRA